MSDFLQKLIDYEQGNQSKTLEEYLDITSNEIFFDDVFLCRLYDWKIKTFANHEKDRHLLSMVLFEVIWRILQKGGIPEDLTGKFQHVIDKYSNNYIDKQLAMEIANFQMQNPEYGGEDWSGIWFYPSQDVMGNWKK